MSEQHDLDAHLDAWLAVEGSGRAPDRMFEHVFTVVQASRQVRAWPVPTLGQRRMPVRAALAIAAIVLAVAAVGGVVGGLRLFFEHQTRLQPTPVVVDGTLFATTCPHPNHLARVGSSVWVVCPDQVRRIDTTNGRVTGALSASAFAADEGQVWVAREGEVDVLDPVTLSVRSTLTIPAAGAIALDSTTAWIARPSQKQVVGVDRTSFATTSTIDLGASPGAVAAAGRSIWVALPDQGRVDRIDPATGSVLASLGVDAPGAMTVGPGRIFVIDLDLATITEIDAATNAISRRGFGAGLPAGSTSATPNGIGGGIVVAGSSLWEVGGTDAVETDLASGAILRILRVAAPSGVSLVGVTPLSTIVLVLDGQGDRVLSLPP